MSNPFRIEKCDMHLTIAINRIMDFYFLSQHYHFVYTSIPLPSCLKRMSIHSSRYTIDEDKFLCQVYMKISQDPIKGVYQSTDQFWSCVEEAYHNGKIATWTDRSKRSIPAWVQTIEKAARKLHACIRQCENRRPSGASNEDIILL